MHVACRIFIALVLFTFVFGMLYGQVDTPEEAQETAEAADEEGRAFPVIEFFEDSNLPDEAETISEDRIERVLPGGFLEFQLGSEEQFINQTLIESEYFLYNGEPLVSFRTSDREYVFDVIGRGYIDRALFQFKDEILEGIDLYFNTEEIDYYTLHTRFSSKYGDPDSVFPQYMVWENTQMFIRISKDARIQYIQKTQGVPPATPPVSTLENFLDLF